MPALQRIGAFVFGTGLLVLVGCSGGSKMAEVQGTVTLNGQPLDKIQVEFWPEVDGPRSYAVTDSQGRYSLITDDGKRKGAVIGRHRIVLRDAGVWGDKAVGREAEGRDLAKGKKIRIPQLYGDSATTPLKKDVVSGANTIDLPVK